MRTIDGAVVASLFVFLSLAVPAWAEEQPAAVPGKVEVSALQPGTGTQHYAAPDGARDGDGSRERPWDLAVALTSKAVKPGDTVWLRGGTYACRSLDPGQRHPIVACTLRGEEGKPVMVAQCPGERATLTGRLNVAAGAAYTWFWDFEMSSPAKTRVSQQAVSWPPSDLDVNGLDVLDNSRQEGPGLKFINLVIHDTNFSGVNLWQQAIDAEVNGCIVYYNGWRGPAGDRCHGHGLYTQNRKGIKKIVDNVFFKQFMFGTQLYGSGQAYVDGYDYVGNILFNNGAPGGRLEINLLVSPVNCEQWHFNVSDNHVFHSSDLNRTSACLGYAWHKQEYEKITVNNNHFIGATYLYWWRQLEAAGNVFYGKLQELPLPGSNLKFATFDRGTNHVLTERPKGVEVFVRPNRYEAGRANVMIYNWDLRDAVAVDASGVLPPGAGFEVRDVQNWFGEPVVKGVYDGKPISIPMKGLTVAAPIGIEPDPLIKHTAPEFGVFVIRKAGEPR